MLEPSRSLMWIALRIAARTFLRKLANKLVCDGATSLIRMLRKVLAKGSTMDYGNDAICVTTYLQLDVLAKDNADSAGK